MPKRFRSKEFFQDKKFLETVHDCCVATADLGSFDFSSIRVGDILFFNSKLHAAEFNNPKYFHIVVCIENNPTFQPQFIHARLYKDSDAVAIWPLQKFIESKRYTVLRGVRRVTKKA